MAAHFCGVALHRFKRSPSVRPDLQFYGDSGGDEVGVGARGVYSQTLAVRRCLQPLGTSSSPWVCLGRWKQPCEATERAPRFGPHGG